MNGSLPLAPPARRKRILLGQLLANGDCLYATTVARQIKTDDPACHLTWAVSTRCRQVLRNNPDVDEIWEIPLEQKGELRDHWARAVQAWEELKREACARRDRGDFDEVYLTQIDFGRAEVYDGTIRSFILSGYPRPITVSVSPVVLLEEEEVASTARFAAAHPAIGRCAHVLLFECAPKSGQSFVTPDFALSVSRELVGRRDDVCVLLSSNLPIDSGHERIVDASPLSFRENAEMTKYCTLLVGCSSGLSWLATSDWAKPLPMVQLLTGNAFWPNSFIHDHERQGLPTDHILEMIDCSVEHARDGLLTIFNEGFAAARLRFHERISLQHSYGCILKILLAERRFGAAACFLLRNLRRDWPARGLILSPLGIIAGVLVESAPSFFGRRRSSIGEAP